MNPFAEQLRNVLNGSFNKNSNPEIEKIEESLTKICTHKMHNPPNNLYVPTGKQYRHVCPGCKQEKVLNSPIEIANN